MFRQLLELPDYRSLAINVQHRERAENGTTMATTAAIAAEAMITVDGRADSITDIQTSDNCR
jgi:hypothetical protein